MIEAETLNELRDALLEKRRAIIGERRKLDIAWQAMNEPETEMEESAIKRVLARDMETLDTIG